MHRNVLAAAIAALLAGAACTTEPPPPSSITLYWRFLGSQGQPYGDGTERNTGCLGANVDQVRLVLTAPGGVFWDDYTFPCAYGPTGVPGVVYDFVPEGTWTYALEGIRQGLTVYYASGVLDVFGPVVRTVPLAADYPDLLIRYTLPAGVTCATNWTGFPLGQIAFSMLNTVAPYVEEYGSANVSVTCQDPPNDVITAPSIPPATYHMRYISALTPTVIPPAAAYQECAVPFTHGDLVDEVTFYLTQATGACP